MPLPKYSVVIRTLGTAGDKYAALLRSIEQQTLAPEEVVVVLADGYAEPPHHIPHERIVRTRKGMVHQRQVGFEQARSPFLLVMDDDIALPSDYAETTLRIMQETEADAAFSGGDERGKQHQNLRYLLLGERYLSRRKSPYYLRIGSTGGTIVNARMQPSQRYWCQTANFQCFMMRKEAALGTHLEEEMWLEDTGYAWPDDRVFFYKAFRKGYKTVYVPETHYTNLNAQSGHDKSQDKTYTDYYTHQRNIAIFWHKYLCSKQLPPPTSSRFLCRILFAYGCTMQTLLFFVKCLVRRHLKLLPRWREPYKDAQEYLRKIPS